MPIQRHGSPRCDGLNRRDFLHLGVITGLGLSLADLLRLQSTRAAGAGLGSRPKAVSCILIWLDGGPSHLDTFDPKPNAPPSNPGVCPGSCTTL